VHKVWATGGLAVDVPRKQISSEIHGCFSVETAVFWPGLALNSPLLRLLAHLRGHAVPCSIDVIVVAAAAGTEAALRLGAAGCATLLLTHNLETLGRCRATVHRGHREGSSRQGDRRSSGAMAMAADEAASVSHSQFVQGPAVRATRAQADRLLYKRAIRSRLENQPNLTLFQQAVDDLVLEGDRVQGVITELGVRFTGRAVVLTTGTFLSGLIHIGLSNYRAAAGDPPSISLAAHLRELKLPAGRLKTGTPPRLDGRTIDFSVMKPQPATSRCRCSRSRYAEMHPRQLPCWITHTNPRTHEIIRGGLDARRCTRSHRSIGPRYCPSIEDKSPFRLQAEPSDFLEPEGLTTNEFYPNGISTSLPFDVQVELVRSIRGLENAHLLRPGYAIEYDYYDRAT